MLCDELKVYFHTIKKSITGHTSIGLAYYSKSDVDAAIDELKSAHHKERHEYIKMVAELKQKLEDAKATAYAESVDAGMRERRLRRALYKACANWAKAYRYPSFRKFESRCLKMAEEYK